MLMLLWCYYVKRHSFYFPVGLMYFGFEPPARASVNEEIIKAVEVLQTVSSPVEKGFAH